MKRPPEPRGACIWVGGFLGYHGRAPVRGRPPTALELKDVRIADDAVADFDGTRDGLVGVPPVRSRHYSVEERKQGLADFPAGRIPKIRRAVVHRVVVDVTADAEHRLVERGGASPAESHAFVAGNVNNQAVRLELRQVFGPQVRQRRVRILQGAIDHDVRGRKERSQRLAPVVRDDLAEERGLAVVVELHNAHRMDRGPDGGHAPVGQHLDIMDAVGIQGRDSTACCGTETDDHSTQPPAIVTG